MLFGFFKRRERSKPLQGNPPAASVPIILEDSRLAQLEPILWQDARYGMTVGEVSVVHSDCIRSPSDERLGDGNIAELMVPHLELGNHDYRVLFYFKSKQLTQVTIKSNGRPQLSDFRDLIGALRLRYGQEVEIEEVRGSFSTAEWLSIAGINVNLVCHPEIDCLSVNFQYRYADTAMKL